MKETMRQTIQRLAADNKVLREKNSALSTDWANAVNKCNELNTELSYAKARLNEADHRARKLIRSANIVRNTQTSERRLALEAARAKAMATGSVVKV